MRFSRPRTLALLAAASVAALAVSAAGSADAASRKAVAHHAGGKKTATSQKAPTPKLFDLNHHAGEPTLGINGAGHIFVTAGAGCVTSCLGSTYTVETVAPGGRAVIMTSDKGKTFRDISPGTNGVSPHVTSLDPYILVDRTPEVDRTFDIDLNAACNILSYSDDEGATWISNPLSCGEPVNDHQTLFVGKPVTSPIIGLYPNIVYYCFNKIRYTDCTKSLDGGITFLPTANTVNPECSGLNGHGVTDSRGWVYIPYAGCNEAPTIAVSKDEGASWTSIHPAPASVVNGGDPSLAIDKKDNLYFLWNDGSRKPLLTVSKNGGQSWGKPIDVSAPGVKRTNLATLTVGAPGKIAIAYYGTTAESGKAFWNGYLATGTGLLGKKPLFYSASVNDPKHALKWGDCGPGRCGRVLDFIDVEIAPDGQPWAVYVDACAETCEQTKTESLADNEGMLGTLSGGVKLR